MNRHERAAQRHCPGPDHRPEAPMKTPATAACNRRVTGVQPRATAFRTVDVPTGQPISMGWSGTVVHGVQPTVQPVRRCLA